MRTMTVCLTTWSSSGDLYTEYKLTNRALKRGSRIAFLTTLAAFIACASPSRNSSIMDFGLASLTGSIPLLATLRRVLSSYPAPDAPVMTHVDVVWGATRLHLPYPVHTFP